MTALVSRRALTLVNALSAAYGAFVSALAAAGGAGLVGFKQANAGAVLRSVAGKLGEVVSVTDFGAVGDGATDCTAAIQAALNSAAEVNFPPGVYVSSKLSITRNVIIRGEAATLLHKAGAASQNNGLIESLQDFKFVIRGLTIDGNAGNQPDTSLYQNMVWCAIGSMELHGCTIRNTRGHLIRTGNIDAFDAAKFAHDIVIDSCTIQNGTANAGDCVRIERTRGAWISGNIVYGGQSGIRTQLFCKNLRIINNEVSYSFADVGITAAMSEGIWILDNDCHHHFQHGIEVDAVVDSRVEGNFTHNNGKCGIFSACYGSAGFNNSPAYSGSISDNYGVNYSAQTYTSPMVPSINASFKNNKVIANGHPDRFIGCESDVYEGNYVNNGAVIGGYAAQLSIEGGPINKTGLRVIDNTFVVDQSNSYVIRMASYQFTAYVSGNLVIGDKPMASFAAFGMRDLNASNRYLLDTSKRTALLVDAADAAAKNGVAVTHTTTGDQTYIFTGIAAEGTGEKMVRLVARAAAGPQTAYVTIVLVNAAGGQVTTLVNEQAISLTAAYGEFRVRVPANAAVGNSLKVQLHVPVAGVTVYLSELNVHSVS